MVFNRYNCNRLILNVGLIMIVKRPPSNLTKLSTDQIPLVNIVPSRARCVQLIGISNKSVFKIILLSFAIMPIVAFVTFLWVGYTYGLNNVPVMLPGQLNFRDILLAFSRL